MQKIKVLMVAPNLRVSNGVTSFIMNYYRQVNHEEVQMDFALYSDRESPYYDLIKRNGGEIFILPNINSLPEHLKSCRSILTNEKYDIIHDNTLHISIPIMFMAKKLGVPVRILHSHSSRMGETCVKQLRNTLLRPVLRSLATDYLACSKTAGKMMFGRREFKVLPNVICAERFCFDDYIRENVRQKMKSNDKFVVGSVGRLAKEKNPFFAIDVFECLQKKISNAEYWWVGSGPLQEKVKAYVEKKGLQRCIRVLGSRDDVSDLYQGMDAFFLPSLFEGLPVTGVEAQAMGLPMVVSDTVTNEMVYTELVDYVNLKESVEVWAGHLEKALQSNSKREKYAALLQKSAFSDVRCGERLVDIYRVFLQKIGG